MLQRLRMKLEGAVMPWTCVLLGHYVLPPTHDSVWWKCSRHGCSFADKWEGW